jgi:hypothetical protein
MRPWLQRSCYSSSCLPFSFTCLLRSGCWKPSKRSRMPSYLASCPMHFSIKSTRWKDRHSNTAQLNWGQCYLPLPLMGLIGETGMFLQWKISGIGGNSRMIPEFPTCNSMLDGQHFSHSEQVNMAKENYWVEIILIVSQSLGLTWQIIHHLFKCLLGSSLLVSCGAFLTVLAEHSIWNLAENVIMSLGELD